MKLDLEKEALLIVADMIANGEIKKNEKEKALHSQIRWLREKKEGMKRVFDANKHE